MIIIDALQYRYISALITIYGTCVLYLATKKAAPFHMKGLQLGARLKVSKKKKKKKNEIYSYRSVPI